MISIVFLISVFLAGILSFSRLVYCHCFLYMLVFYWIQMNQEQSLFLERRLLGMEL